MNSSEPNFNSMSESSGDTQSPNELNEIRQELDIFLKGLDRSELFTLQSQVNKRISIFFPPDNKHFHTAYNHGQKFIDYKLNFQLYSSLEYQEVFFTFCYIGFEIRKILIGAIHDALPEKRRKEDARNK